LKLTLLIDDKGKVKDFRLTRLIKDDKVLASFKDRLRDKTLIADKGYDTKRIYAFFGYYNVNPIIKPNKLRKPYHKLRGYMLYRWMNNKEEMNDLYSKRWHIERFFSLLKRTFRDGIKSKRYVWQEYAFKLYYVSEFMFLTRG